MRLISEAAPQGDRCRQPRRTDCGWQIRPNRIRTLARALRAAVAAGLAEILSASEVLARRKEWAAQSPRGACCLPRRFDVTER